MKNHNLFLYVILLLPNLALSKTYFCPRLPVDIEIGKTYDSEWFAWKQSEYPNWINRQYYKIVKNKYHFQTWTGFMPKSQKFEKEYGHHYIACCETQRQEKVEICMFRRITEQKCKIIRKYLLRDKFLCFTNKPSKLG